MQTIKQKPLKCKRIALIHKLNSTATVYENSKTNTNAAAFYVKRYSSELNRNATDAGGNQMKF